MQLKEHPAHNSTQSVCEDRPMTGAQVSSLRSDLPLLLPLGHEVATGLSPGGWRRWQFQLQELSWSLLLPSCQYGSYPAQVAGRGAQCSLSSRSAGHLPLLQNERLRTSPGGAASGQVIQVYFGDWVSPVAEGAELWAWKGRILFLIEKWEHVLHELAQSVIPRRDWERNTQTVTVKLT